ncbi:hypothetical protein TSAR_003944 [Trichomalopsis sarcophagae]|uniref:Uncharacterized protein n=1 Tax=Trichomalopsis sarcophagae TaxID=543379 RepID=A0A232ET30_9HYME|nr:hypothetical protein TSAR_003944 [Trichomalopsis sarcophagae]
MRIWEKREEISGGRKVRLEQ